MALLHDLSEFLRGFEGMYEGFSQRAKDVSALLGSPRTVFLLVTVPEEEPIAEADFFWRALVERALPFGGVIVNKVHPTYLDGGASHADLRDAAARELAQAGIAEGLAARAAENLLHYEALAARDRANIRALTARIGPEPVLEVPFLDHDVHDLDGLLSVAHYLFASRAGERAAH
jgi:anion-transporting  ArsA/GET3 family ATPase